VLIHDLLAQGFTRSFEYFPPKSDEEAATLRTTLHELSDLHPSFVSVTYRGGAVSRQRTFDLVTSIERDEHVTAMAHVICVGHTKAEIRDLLERYQAAGISNLMALGGDVPEDPQLQASEFHYASELVELAREVGTFSIGVGAHPVGHPRSIDLESDRRYLAHKLSIADFAVTQFFFYAEEWANLVAELNTLGVSKPVLPGIMPVTTLSGATRMAQMGAAVPPALMERLEQAHHRGGPSAVRAEGISAAVELCEALIDHGAPGLHFYTLNRSTATREMHTRLFGEGS
jgi:methylenetetrahydrofolate reductase (NADPH)